MITEINKRFKAVISYLIQNCSDAYVVGGFNRERLLGRLSLDIDLAVDDNAWELAQNIAKRFRCAFVPLDQERDIARVVFQKDLSIDIARYAGKSLAEDLQCRDLTINSIACQLHPGLFDLSYSIDALPFYDPCHGKQDIKQKLIRGNSKANFESDPLRLLRAFRFSALLGFEIEHNTYQWIQELSYRICEPSSERVLAELAKILVSEHSSSIFCQMMKSGLVHHLFSGLNLEQESLHILTSTEQLILEHSNRHIFHDYINEPLTQSRPRLFVLKLLALFYNQSFEAVESLAASLTLSSKEWQLIKLCLQQIQSLNQLFVQKSPPTNIQLFHLFRNLKKDIIGLLLFGWASASKPEQFKGFVNDLITIYHDLSNPIAHPPTLVSGKDIMTHLKLVPGPLIGQLLLRIQEAQADGLIKDKEQALIQARVWVNQLNT